MMHLPPRGGMFQHDTGRPRGDFGWVERVGRRLQSEIAKEAQAHLPYLICMSRLAGTIRSVVSVADLRTTLKRHSSQPMSPLGLYADGRRISMSTAATALNPRP
jgi:hypothetical protein